MSVAEMLRNKPQHTHFRRVGNQSAEKLDDLAGEAQQPLAGQPQLSKAQ